SQIGAWASPQSQVIEGRDWLDEEYLKFSKVFKEKNPGRPEHWGGYYVQPVIIEFWQGRPSRLHDRIQYTRSVEGGWKIERLAP
ncbi:MAG TPA: pyridoxine 5'-phosphate oxidase C-terminal domain-containing protein, partial [Flavisolibacter sp.]|nr:pyridoxine 5'-phosphate oxidase C-terminal domain-containing protein [Flavisolibacter sp.]